jgi:catechol 2,3-dioxygenase-like lactoylglutathione lyase family enzyme
MIVQQPGKTLGLRHVALNVADVGVCERFYVDLLGMTVEWRPDADNVYLTSGNDNLALHRVVDCNPAETPQKLDHLGFFVASEALVDDWYAYLKVKNVDLKAAPRTHRDGARSFYCADPEGTVVQIIYYPPIAD